MKQCIRTTDLSELFMDKCLDMDVEIRIGDGGLVELEEQKNSDEELCISIYNANNRIVTTMVPAAFSTH